MYRCILPLLFLGLFINVNADSAVQTDWSGGSGVLGPVIDWGNDFYQSSCINWSDYPGSLRLLGYLEHTIEGNFDGAISVYSEDFDGDGDMDVLGAAYLDDDITWWENADGSGTSWTEHIVDGNFNGVRSIHSTDINGDGDMDVIGAAFVADNIAYWENADGSGTSWYERTIDGDFAGAISVYSEDINGDGDMDVVGAAYDANSIAYWENANGSGTSWYERTIDGDFAGAISIYSEDIDGDGDMDLLGAAYTGWDLTWWENVNGAGTVWSKHIIHGNFYYISAVYAADINGDGDMDVLAAARPGWICWWENTGSATSWIQRGVDWNFTGAWSVLSEDMDGDGDMDVLGAAVIADDISWWENLDGSGTSWTEHIVDGNFNGASSVYSEDLDGDGDMDVLGSAQNARDIAWWNLTPTGWLESSIFDIQQDPDWDYLEWNSQTPSGTSVSFQVRASDDHTSMGAWSDTLSIPGLLQGILTDGDQYVQYRAILETSDPDATPVLLDLMLTWDPMGIEGGEDPAVLALLPFSPNPSSLPAVRFSLPEPASIDLSIFDLSGRLVSEVHGVEYSPGYHDVLLGDLSPGIYFCRMTSGNFTATQRFVVID